MKVNTGHINKWRKYIRSCMHIYKLIIQTDYITSIIFFHHEQLGQFDKYVITFISIK